MTRAALLPTMADPYLLTLWLNHYHRCWHTEVDQLYVEINTTKAMREPVLEYVRQKLRSYPKVTVLEHYNTDHGQSIGRLLEACSEDYVVLLEDDAPILRSGEIAKNFGVLERNEADLLGVPRGSCHPAIEAASERKYGVEAHPYCEHGYNWWPCFLFTSRQRLLDTDRNFSGASWETGSRIEELDLDVTDGPYYGDTFVWASIQLRAQGIHPQHLIGYHSYPADLSYRDQRKHLWSPECGWIHIGSLSSLAGGGEPDCNPFAPPERYITTLAPIRKLVEEHPTAKTELTRRWAWISVIHQRSRHLVDPVLGSTFTHNYQQNIRLTIDQLALHETELKALVAAYHELFDRF